MERLKASAVGITLPPDVIQELAQRIAAKWSGTVTLNFKEGDILSFEVTEKKRVLRETHVSPDQRRGTHIGQQLQHQ